MKRKPIIVILISIIVVLSLFLFLLTSTEIFKFDPTPSIKIENEEEGTMYTVGILRFNLPTNDYKIVNEDKKAFGDEDPSILYTLQKEDTQSFVLLVEHKIDDLKELFSSMSDSEKYKEVKDTLEVEYYEGNNKAALLHKEKDSYLFLKVEDSYFTFTINSDTENETEIYFEIMRTANISK